MIGVKKLFESCFY